MIDKKFSKVIGDTLDDILSYKGICVRCDKEYLDLDKCEVYIKGNAIDDSMVAYMVAKMFQEGKIDFTGKAFEIGKGKMSDVDYLKKLLGDKL